MQTPNPNSTYQIRNTVNITATAQDPNALDGGIYGMQIFVADWNGTTTWCGGHQNCNGGSTASISYQWAAKSSSNYGAYATAVNNFGFVGGSTSVPFVVVTPTLQLPPPPPHIILSNYTFIDIESTFEGDRLYFPAIRKLLPFLKTATSSLYGGDMSNSVCIVLTGADLWGDPKTNMQCCIATLSTLCTINSVVESEDGSSAIVNITDKSLQANDAWEKINTYLETVTPTNEAGNQ